MRVAHLWIVVDAAPLSTVDSICKKLDPLNLSKLQGTFWEVGDWKKRGAKFYTDESEAKRDARARIDKALQGYYRNEMAKGKTKAEIDRDIAQTRRKSAFIRAPGKGFFI